MQHRAQRAAPLSLPFQKLDPWDPAAKQWWLAAAPTHAATPGALAVEHPDPKVTPVILPPGRLRLVTRPLSIGSPPRMNTIGMVEVAARAACMETFGPTITE